jgi:hypothetical protein
MDSVKCATLVCDVVYFSKMIICRLLQGSSAPLCKGHNPQQDTRLSTPTFHCDLSRKCRGKAQAVYRWHLTTVTRRTVKVSELCGEQSGIGIDFSPSS